jgi:hypothetical protein
MNKQPSSLNSQTPPSNDEPYFLTLYHQAAASKLLDSSAAAQLATESMAMLSETVKRYTHRSSTSVPVEIARDLAVSNLYVISLYLKTLPGQKAAMAALTSQPFSALYDAGFAILKRKINVARYFLTLVKKTKLKTPNLAYNDTIDHGLDLFFTAYNLEFAAHETPGSIDYQLIHPVLDLTGIEYILSYLQRLYYENLFCQKFDPKTIHRLMMSYHKDYRELLDNLCLQVYKNALTCSLLNKEIPSLAFHHTDLFLLEETWQAKNQADLLEQLQTQNTALCQSLKIVKPSQKHYLEAALNEIAASILHALKTDTLEKVFVPIGTSPARKTVSFDMGIKMDDRFFREFLEEFNACRFNSDKLQLIKKDINALADLNDLLLLGEVTAPEAHAIFDLLKDVELGALAKLHSLFEALDDSDLSQAEIRYRQYLQSYLLALPQKRSDKIRFLSDSLCMD